MSMKGKIPEKFNVYIVLQKIGLAMLKIHEKFG